MRRTVLLPGDVASATLPRMSLPRHWLSFVLVLTVVAGCPRRFDPRANEVHSQNPQADAEYRTAQRQIERGDWDAAKAALQHIQASYPPSEPLVGWARLQEARIARAQQQYSRARELVQPLSETGTDEALRSAARFELGLVAHRLRDLPLAIRLLAAFSNQIVDGDDATELHAVLADCYQANHQAREALQEYELFFRRARPTEQAYIRSQVPALLDQVSSAEAQDARSRFGLAGAGRDERISTGSGLRIGMALPLSGKDRAIGERVLRGARWAARSGLSSGPTGSAPPPARALAVDLVVRDTGSSPDTAARVVSELAAEGVQVLVASPARAEDAALVRAAVAQRLLTLRLATPVAANPAAEASGFFLLHSNEARAQRLAAELRASGLSSVATLAPASTYGQTMTKAFVDALQGSSVKVLGQLTFPANATTFTAQAKQLLELGPQALFVPVTATQLELVAGQLAALGALSTQRVQAKENEPPIRLVLSMAEGLSARLLNTAGRYLQGAVLAPVALAGLPTSGIESHFAGYAADGGGEPGVVDAIGFDAIQTLRAACSAQNAKSDTCTHDQLAATLPLLQLEGTTGTIAFLPQGPRRGQPVLVRVEGSAVRVLR